MEVKPSEALYIKLGSKDDKWENGCIHEKQILKLGYKEINHELCLRGEEWETKVKEECKNFRRSNVGAATRDVNQIRWFYEAKKDVLWITFHANMLWWCFSTPEVT